MKKIFLLVSFCLFSFAIIAQHVDAETAKLIAENFLSSKSNLSNGRQRNGLELVFMDGPGESFSSSKQTYFYVFNSKSNEGFVIVSGDEHATPILGYSESGSFDAKKLPPNFLKWLEGYKSEIRYALEHKVENSSEGREAWQALKNGVRANAGSRTKAVTPLLKTQWDQSPFYNALTPQNSVTGCVATAMAQIMKFWNYPTKGSGFHSYNHEKFGTLSANFGATNYDWASMPNTLNGTNNAIATLMYHCGVSVDMNYSPTISGAYVISAKSAGTHCSEYALETYFGYQNTLSGIERDKFTATSWMTAIKNELDAGRPILYAGFGGGGGHAFVCDGYDNNNFFHFNWGWGGFKDSYFQLSALNPDGVGTGGGEGGYNSGQHALIGIQPPSNIQSHNLRVTKNLTLSSATIGYGNSFSITTNIANKGTNSFTGDYTVAAFDTQGNFIEYIATKSNQTLQGGFTYNSDLVFLNQGSLKLLPGTYTIGLYFRPTGGEWSQVNNDAGFTSTASLKIVNTNNIALNSAINITQGTTLTAGKPVSATLNIRNDGTTTFKGEIDLSLYNLDGTLAQTIFTFTESSGLPSGFTYASPFLSFTNASVSVDPGTYLLAVQHNPDNTGWQLTGSSNTFQNPITVTVVASPLTPDSFEQNNTVAQAKNLPVVFSQNTSSIATSNTNCHIGTDYDFYKIVLPAGYNYKVKPRLHDEYNSGNSISYSLDALFSYSFNGTTWSEAYDDVVSTAFDVKDGGTVYFHVAPYFSGETGTYLLDIVVTRDLVVGIEENSTASLVNIFPNPANNYFAITLKDAGDDVARVLIKTIQGQEIYSREINTRLQSVDIESLKAGVYIVTVKTANGTVTKKLFIER